MNEMTKLYRYYEPVNRTATFRGTSSTPPRFASREAAEQYAREMEPGLEPRILSGLTEDQASIED